MSDLNSSAVKSKELVLLGQFLLGRLSANLPELTVPPLSHLQSEDSNLVPGSGLLSVLNRKSGCKGLRPGPDPEQGLSK